MRARQSVTLGNVSSISFAKRFRARPRAWSWASRKGVMLEVHSARLVAAGKIGVLCEHVFGGLRQSSHPAPRRAPRFSASRWSSMHVGAVDATPNQELIIPSAAVPSAARPRRTRRRRPSGYHLQARQARPEFNKLGGPGLQHTPRRDMSPTSIQAAPRTAFLKPRRLVPSPRIVEYGMFACCKHAAAKAEKAQHCSIGWSGLESCRRSPP